MNNYNELRKQVRDAFVDDEKSGMFPTVDWVMNYLIAQGRIVPDGYVAVPLEALRALTPFEIVGGDSIKRTNPHSNVNLNSGCHWAVSNGDRPAYKLRDAIAKLNAAAPKGEK